MRKTLVAMFAGLALVATACSIDVESNPDGSLTITSTIDETRLQSAIDRSIEDPTVEELDIDFRDGFVTVEGRGPDETTGRVNETSFDAELSVEDGHLAVDLTNAFWNGEPMPLWIVEIWNESLARNLEREGRKNPDATLTSVEVTDGEVVMVWHVETEASKR